MRLIYDYFIRPYWMELLGILCLVVSLFVSGQLIVDVGFALLMAGTIVNGVSNLKEQFRQWRRLKPIDQGADFAAPSAYNAEQKNLTERH